MSKPTPHQVGQAGEHFVAGEILRRGGHASTFAGNMPAIDVLASDGRQDRTVYIQVKTRRRGDWQTSINHGRRRRPVKTPTRFWVLVDLSDHAPEFYVMPEWWAQNHIYTEHHEWLERVGGQRPSNPQSKHARIRSADIEQWKGRWDLLGIFDA